VVITVHDIIPYLTRANHRLTAYRHPIHRWFDVLAMRGLDRADAIIADSRWTKATLVGELGISASKITTVPLGVDRARFRAIEVPTDFRERHGLPAGHEYVLYVGSEDPRKNLDTLLAAFAAVHRERPAARLLKVGGPQLPAWRHRLRRLAGEFGIAHAVRFFDHVPDEDLPLFYNAAAVCAMPSLYEGFGLPVVEAVACGTPVVCSDRASLAELAGDGVTLTPPTVDGFVAALNAVLASAGRPLGRAEVGSAAPVLVSWEESARQVLSVYEVALGSGGEPRNVGRAA
jgi:glycosyltransferase involved in cell wall biosynthesis